MPSQIRRNELKSGKVNYTVRVKLPNGETVYETFDKKGEAEIRKGQLIDERRGGSVYKPTSQRLGTYLDHWLAGAQHALRENTLESYSDIVETYIKPKLGKVPLKKLTRAVIQQAYNEMTAEGLSPRTVRYTHSILHGALAAIDGMTEEKNPARAATKTNRQGVQLPKKKGSTQKMRPLSAEEAREFLNIVDEIDDDLDQRRPLAKAKEADAKGVRIAAPISALFHVLISAGLRPSEAFALKWADVNLEADDQGQGRVTVTKSLTRLKDGSWILNDPKTNASSRTVPVPPETLAALRKHRIRQQEHRLKAGDFWRAQGFVFTTAFGDPIEIKNITNRHFKPALRELARRLHPVPDGEPVPPGVQTLRAEIVGTRFYDQRHTCATLSLLAGVNVKAISERLGHASVVITLDTYAHVLPSMQQEATSLLGAVIYG